MLPAAFSEACLSSGSKRQLTVPQSQCWSCSYITRVVQPVRVSVMWWQGYFYSPMATGLLLCHVSIVVAGGGSGGCLPALKALFCCAGCVQPLCFLTRNRTKLCSAEGQLSSQAFLCQLKYLIPAHCSLQTGKLSEAREPVLVLSQWCPERSGSCCCPT